MTNKVINQNEVIHCDLKGQMIKLNQEHKKLIDNKFSELEHSSFEKYKLL